MVLSHLLDDGFHVEDLLDLAVDDQVFALELFLLKIVSALEPLVFIEQLDLSFFVISYLFFKDLLTLQEFLFLVL